MHMADALVAPAVAGTMYLLSAGAGGYSIKRVKLEDEGKKIPVMGVMGAFVFAAQMLNFTLPGTAGVWSYPRTGSWQGNRFGFPM